MTNGNADEWTEKQKPFVYWASCAVLENKKTAHRLRGVSDLVFTDGGDKGSRTPDLLNAIETLYQLSYIPNAVKQNKVYYLIIRAACQLGSATRKCKPAQTRPSAAPGARRTVAAEAESPAPNAARSARPAFA